MEILKDKIYTVEDYKFVNFIQLDRDTIEQIRLWRNHPDIRKYMYNSDEISEEEHLNFVKTLKDRTDKFYWLVYKNNEPLGVINLVKVDFNEESAESGYYLLPNRLTSGEGLEFVFEINYFFFSILGLKVISGNIEVENKNALILSKYLGSIQEQEVLNIDNKLFFKLQNHFNSFMAVYPLKNNTKSFIKFYKNNK